MRSAAALLVAAHVLCALPSAHAAPCEPLYPFARNNGGLQRALEKRVAQAGWQKYIDQKLLAVSVVDLTADPRLFYAGINDDEMMYAASMPKILILLGVVNAAAQGRVTWDHEFDRRLSNMIRASSNSDATWGVTKVGFDGLADVTQQSPYCLYDREQGGGLWVGRAYGGMAGSNREPLKNLSHAATTRQVARFYTMLYFGRLVSKHWSFRMLNLMAPPEHNHKFVRGLRERSGTVFLARKSGTWRNYHADSAIIRRNGRTYVAVAMCELRKGEEIMQEIVRAIDDSVADGSYRKRRRR